MGGALPSEGGCGLLPCGQGLVGVLPAQSALVLRFLQSSCFGGGRFGYVLSAHLVPKPVHSEFGLVLDHIQVMPNDQVSDDFAFALKLGRLGRKGLALMQRSLDLAADRPQRR